MTVEVEPAEQQTGLPLSYVAEDYCQYRWEKQQAHQGQLGNLVMPV